MSICSTSSSNGVSGFLAAALERIEIDHDQVDRLDALRGDRGEVVGPMAPGEDAAVDLGMEGLDPAVHHLGKAGHVRHIGDGQAGVGKGLGRSRRSR